MFRVSERLYRTVDGRLVGHNHPDAAFLAFVVGQELSDEEARRHGLIAEAKQGPRPLDKMAARPANKTRPTSTKETVDDGQGRAGAGGQAGRRGADRSGGQGQQGEQGRQQRAPFGGGEVHDGAG